MTRSCCCCCVLAFPFGAGRRRATKGLEGRCCLDQHIHVCPSRRRPSPFAACVMADWRASGTRCDARCCSVLTLEWPPRYLRRLLPTVPLAQKQGGRRASAVRAALAVLFKYVLLAASALLMLTFDRPPNVLCLPLPTHSSPDDIHSMLLAIHNPTQTQHQHRHSPTSPPQQWPPHH